ncbi:hypothetical protein RQP46_006854 [Phenoliferia psychrophenolica]
MKPKKSKVKSAPARPSSSSSQSPSLKSTPSITDIKKSGGLFGKRSSSSSHSSTVPSLATLSTATSSTSLSTAYEKGAKDEPPSPNKRFFGRRASVIPAEALERRYPDTLAPTLASSTSTNGDSIAPALAAMSFDKPDEIVPSFALFAPKRELAPVGRTGTKLSSKTGGWDLPTTWQSYSDRYSKSEVDVEDPPAPPTRRALEAVARRSLPPTPFDEGFWPAPLPSSERARQSFVHELDLLATRRTPSTPGSPSRSLASHPAFAHLIRTCRDSFDTPIAMLTILDGETQLFLASSGLPASVASLPRNAGFCAHTILNEDRGLVVLDSQRDWRFSNGGVPLMAPTFGRADAPPIILGTLCLLDDRPHEGFSEALRERLRELSAEATREIEGFVNSRMSDKLARLGELSDEAKAADALPPSPPSSSSATTSTSVSPQNFPPRTEPTLLPSLAPAATPPRSLERKRSTDLSTSTATGSSPQSHKRDTGPMGLRVVSEEPVPSAQPVAKDVQKVFDTATRMLSKSLDLAFVYLVSIDLADREHRLTLLSSCGLPSPPPAFDPSLHFKALRADEGGVLYQNKKSTTGFASGILIPILEVRKVGFVLAGFTHDQERELGPREMQYFTKFGVNLESWVSRVGRS